jgi:hypothetical protein
LLEERVGAILSALFAPFIHEVSSAVEKAKGLILDKR